VIALGAGAFFTGLLRYIIRIDELKNIINLTVIKGFICYSGAMLILSLDVGQPIRSWFGYWHPNVHSMLTEVIFCITCYLMVLIIEYVPLILEQKQINKIPFLHNLAHQMHVVMPLFAGIGAFLSTFHQGRSAACTVSCSPGPTPTATGFSSGPGRSSCSSCPPLPRARA
jgi:molybdopterin-containing oxidoreductase family membrane subunit